MRLKTNHDSSWFWNWSNQLDLWSFGCYLKVLIFFLFRSTTSLELKMSLSTSVGLKGEQGSHQGTKSKTEGLTDSQTTSVLQGTPLQNLRLASQAVLERAQKQGRSICPKCHGSRKFYCYTCYIPVEAVPTREIPVVKVSGRDIFLGSSLLFWLVYLFFILFIIFYSCPSKRPGSGWHTTWILNLNY